MRSSILLALIPLVGCRSATVTPAPAPVTAYRSHVTPTIILEFPASTHVAVFVARPGEPLARISPDDTAAVRRLTLPLPGQPWARQQHEGDRSVILVGSMNDQFALFGGNTTSLGYARVVWEPGQSLGPSSRETGATWLTVLLDGPRTLQVDSIAATIRGTTLLWKTQVASDLAAALNLAPERVRVVSLN
jgi:hypothetical protein